MSPTHGAISQHIVIYGSPGVGKLTVARELARLTGFKLAHNHLSIDFVTGVFDFGTPGFIRLLDAVRLEMAEEATREGVGLIHTFVLLTDRGVDYLDRLCRAVEDLGGRVDFVQLTCELPELLRRVQTPSRADMKKVTTLDLLQVYLDGGALTKLAPNRESLVIDNTNVEPIEAARRIAEHYKTPVA